MTTISSTELPTKYGKFIVSYHKFKKGYCISLRKGDIKKARTLVRIHSSCVFTESFHSELCDCKLQLSKSMELIGQEGRGVIIYSYEEGRGIGLDNKIKAMELERKKGIDTVEAFKQLHFDTDLRNHKDAVKALRELEISNTIRLITDNPHKIQKLKDAGFSVEREEIKYPISSRVKKYLRVKKEKLGYFISDEMLR